MLELRNKIEALKELLYGNILGQDHVLNFLISHLQGALSGLVYPDRPLASMLFLGPTGVGKTETVRLFSEHLFGLDGLLRFDMSEYITRDSLGLLRGQHERDPGQLGAMVKAAGGRGVILFDEIEKAEKSILDLFLQILSAGRIRLATGEVLDLTGFIIVATSNIGGRLLMESNTENLHTLAKRAFDAAVTSLRPEMVFRFEKIHCFVKLRGELQEALAQLHTGKLLDLFRRHGHDLVATPAVHQYLVRIGVNEQFGARPLQNAILHEIRTLTSSEWLRSGSPLAGAIDYDLSTNRLIFRAKAQTTQPEEEEQLGRCVNY